MRWFRSTRNLKGTIVVLFCTTIASVAFAQKPDAFDAMVANITILQDKTVQREVGISEKQRNQMNVYAQQHSARAKAYVDSLRTKNKRLEPTDQTMLGYFKTLKDNVVGQLTARQLKRLRELSLQQIGVTALADSTVAKRVGLTPAQLKTLRDTLVKGRTEIGKLQRAALEGVLKPYQAIKPKDKAEAERLQKKANGEIAAASQKLAPQVAAISKSTEAKMTAILQPKQLTAWRALLGPKFAPR